MEWKLREVSNEHLFKLAFVEPLSDRYSMDDRCDAQEEYRRRNTFLPRPLPEPPQ